MLWVDVTSISSSCTSACTYVRMGGLHELCLKIQDGKHDGDTRALPSLRRFCSRSYSFLTPSSNPAPRQWVFKLGGEAITEEGVLLFR